MRLDVTILIIIIFKLQNTPVRNKISSRFDKKKLTDFAKDIVLNEFSRKGKTVYMLQKTGVSKLY